MVKVEHIKADRLEKPLVYSEVNTCLHIQPGGEATATGGAHCLLFNLTIKRAEEHTMTYARLQIITEAVRY